MSPHFLGFSSGFVCFGIWWYDPQIMRLNTKKNNNNYRGFWSVRFLGGQYHTVKIVDGVIVTGMSSHATRHEAEIEVRLLNLGRRT